MPEATIIARQMQAELIGATIAEVELRDCESLQRMGFVNKNPEAFQDLVECIVESVVSRGNTLIAKLSAGQNLVIGPEYGGEILLHTGDRPPPARFHLRLGLADASALTIWIKSMGGIYATSDEGLSEHYLVNRDFDPLRMEPTDERLTAEEFTVLVAAANRQLKPVLVGKDAIVVGLSNSAFQDIIYRAGLHPKRRASDLDPAEKRALYDAMRFVVTERLRLGGKSTFRDLYGVPGNYEPAMGPAMKGRPCPACGSTIQKLSLGGGDVFVCPNCQPQSSRPESNRPEAN